jgi:hypothetical protein
METLVQRHRPKAHLQVDTIHAAENFVDVLQFVGDFVRTSDHQGSFMRAHPLESLPRQWRPAYLSA